MKDWSDLSRREFVIALGATYGSAASALASPRSQFLEYSLGEDSPPRERFVNTLCSMCPGGCGLKVRIVHECAVGVRGNKNHPVNRGGLCSRASAVLQDVYNPDRLQQPLRRVGAKGSGKWEPIDWDTAIASVADPLREMRGRGDSHKLSVLLGRDRGLGRESWKRFTRAFGSPNFVEVYPEDNLRVLPAVLATHGVRHRLGNDLANSAYVLSFSSGWLDGHWSTEQAARAFGEFRRGRPGFRPRWVHVEPRFSITAVKADEWLPIRPGTEGTLALGIAHVMIREGLYDRSFVDRHGFGFEDWEDRDGVTHLGFRRFILQDYSPGEVQAVTGVPEGTIFRIAREFSQNRPAVALGYDGGGCGTLPTYDRMAIHALNALGGSIDVPGGITVFQELSLFQGEYPIDEVAERGLAHSSLDGPATRRRLADNAVDLLTQSLESGRPYPIEALILVDADPVFSLAEGERFAAALSSVPLVVAFTAYHNDSSRHADLVLPLLHGLHRWDIDQGYTLKGHPVVSVSQPVMQRPPGMRDPYEVLRAIAVRTNESVAQALPWPDSERAVDAVLQELFDAGKGAAFGPGNEASWAQLLESRGWRAPFARTIKAFKRDVLTGGGWTDPTYFHREWERVFRSPAGKFAFSSAFLAKSFEAMPEQEGSVDPQRRCLPHCPTMHHRRNEAYPLELYVYALPNLVSVSSPNLPWLNDIAGAYMFEKWRTWVEIHPETAKSLHVSEHEHVEVRTPGGKAVLPVKIYSGLMRDVIAIPFGFGRRFGGRWCAGIGENPAGLVEPRTDPLSGASLWNFTRASIRKV